MASRTVSQMIATVQRRTGGQVSPGTIYEALNDANKRIQRLYKWPWLLGEANIQIAATYTTGTISITDGTAALTGTLTAWDTNWKYKKLYMGSNADYRISAFTSPTTATLVQTINTGVNWTDVGYTIFQDTYTLPDDCEPGGEVVIVNPKIRYRLLRLPRFTKENRGTSLGVFFSNFQDSWAEAGYDDTTKKYLICFSPPPSGTTEYKLVYRRRIPDLETLTDQSAIPESFDEALVFMAEYLVKRSEELPGWMEAKKEAYQIITNMRHFTTTPPQDIFSVYKSWPMSQGPSMYGAGMIIAPPSGGL